ncbi:MAG: phytanoyl-CoA dioxygenase family protein [Caldilineaceae bacterium]
MLTQEQKEIFAAKGLLRLEKFLPPDTVRSVQEFMYQLGAKEGAWRNGVWQLAETSERPEFTKPISKKEFNILTTPALRAAMNLLVDGQGVEARSNPSLLFTLPQAGPWTMFNSWHTDAPRQAHGGIPGVQMFTFLEPVRPRGGGTLVVTGSHRLVNNAKFIRSRDVKKRLLQYAYFQALLAKEQPNPDRYLTTPGSVGDVELQVVELHGEPGDVYLMDLRLLHTGSSNTTTTPRFMVTQRYYLESTTHWIKRA